MFIQHSLRTHCTPGAPGNRAPGPERNSPLHFLDHSPIAGPTKGFDIIQRTAGIMETEAWSSIIRAGPSYALNAVQAQCWWINTYGDFALLVCMYKCINPFWVP